MNGIHCTDRVQPHQPSPAWRERKKGKKREERKKEEERNQRNTSRATAGTDTITGEDSLHCRLEPRRIL
jgi:hypothetical protein